MLTTSHHHDHSDTSNVNNEVKKFNRKLRKYMNLITHVIIIDVDQNGIFFTKHGLGKEEICKQTATIIDKLLQTEKVLPICIGWETNQTIRRTFRTLIYVMILKIQIGRIISTVK